MRSERNKPKTNIYLSTVNVFIAHKEEAGEIRYRAIFYLVYSMP